MEYEPTVNTNELISIQGLTKKYGDKIALDSLDLSIPAGQILGLIGPNGAGKTTTIKILVGLARPTSGSAHVAGVDCVRHAKKIKRMVGYMPDKFGSYENMRVMEYLDFFGAAFGLKRSDRRRRIEEVMEMSGTAYMRDMLVDTLSHGMSQRLGIARTLLHDPQVLILDEPANGLDPLARIEMRELLLKLADAGKTLLVTSHILPELSRICHRIAILAQGKLRACGNVAEISRQISPRRTMEVQLNSAEEVSRAADLIRQQMEDEAEVVPAPAERLVRCRTLKTEAQLGTLLSSLVSSGIQVTQFRELQTDLEEAFMTFAREPANDAAAESSAQSESGA